MSSRDIVHVTLSCFLLFFAFRVWAADDTRPEVVWHIDMKGEHPSLVPSAILEARVQIPDGGVFYKDVSPVSGSLIVTGETGSPPLTSLKQVEWSEEFVIAGFMHFTTDDSKVEEIPLAKLGCTWGKVEFIQADGTWECRVPFAFDTDSLKEGLYGLRVRGLSGESQFASKSKPSPLCFVLSDVTSVDDKVNVIEFGIQDSILKARRVDAAKAGAIKKRIKYLDRALAGYEEALLLKTDNPRLLLGKGEVCELKGDVLEAIDAYQKVLEEWSGSESLGDVRAWKRLVTGRNTKADFVTALEKHVTMLERDLKKVSRP